MPNWTNVTIAIHRPDLNDLMNYWEDNFAKRQTRWEIFRNLKNAIQDCDDSSTLEVFNILRPMPNGEWSYNWCCANWGTKWDLKCDHSEVTDNGRTIIVSGMTAWSPPHALLAYLCEDLGFDVECQHYSWENNEWGYYQNEDEESFDLNCPYVAYEDDCRVALRIQGMIEDNPQMSMDDIIWRYLGCDEEQPDYNYLCDEWLTDSTEIECMELDEKYEEWEQKWGSRKDSLREMKHKLLEQIESYLEGGIIDEGYYLKTCNYMKNINDIHILTMFEKGVKFKNNHKIQMINHYNNKPEPPLILMYS